MQKGNSTCQAYIFLLPVKIKDKKYILYLCLKQCGMTDSMKQVMFFLSVTFTDRFSKFQVYQCLKTIYALLLQLNVNLHLYFIDIAINCHSPFQPPVFLWIRVAARLKSLILYQKSNTTDMGLLLKVPDINLSG